MLYTKPGKCLCAATGCENGFLGFTLTEGGTPEDCCEWGNLFEQECDGSFKFTKTGKELFHTFGKLCIRASL